MCVRYVLHKTDAALAAIAQALSRSLAKPDWVQPRFNVALTNVMPVVAAGGAGPELRGMMWGYVPFYERGKPRMRLLPNAKAEMAPESPAFRQAAARRRCLVPANGFYEWRTVGREKEPHVFMLQGEEPFAFAGLWEPGAEQQPETFAILTTEPNELVRPIHNRMPVILTLATMARWLGDQPLPAPEYAALIRPLDAARMTGRPVNRFVSNSRHEGPQCLAPPDLAADTPELPLG
ncbi:MAG TPA: SOS response-associated peptidase [Opitutaceae bacterium]|nr:SOS response-associated peptidase [Opitutaceae bacterium]